MSSNSWNCLYLPLAPSPFFWWWWWSYMMLFACEKIVAHSMRFVVHIWAFWVSLCRIPSYYNPITICLVFLDLIYKMLIVLSVIGTNKHAHTHKMPSLRSTGYLLIPWAPYICICSDYQRYLCGGEALGLITCITKQSCFGDIWTNDMPYSLFDPPFFFIL